MNPLDNPVVFTVVCFGMIGPVLGLGVLIPNTGVFLATLFGLYSAERAYAKATKTPSGSDMIDPNDLDIFKKEDAP